MAGCRRIGLALLVAMWVGGVGVTARAGEPERVKITRDTWVSTHPGEARGNNGGSSRLKLKSIQEMALLDFDAAAFRGRIIGKATLHVRLADAERLWRVTASTVASPWVEGSSTDYREEAGASSYLFAQTPDVPWAYPGSRLNAVMLGLGHTLWGSADASEPDSERWQTIAIDPRVLRACVAGTSSGFVLFDDTGSEWTRMGERFEYRLFPNRRFFAHEQSASAPYLMITADGKDDTGPEAVRFLSGPRSGSGTEDRLLAGEAVVRWETPADRGEAGTMGYEVLVQGVPLPRYLVPHAGAVGEPVECRIEGFPLQPGGEVPVDVVAIDAAGNRGPVATTRVRVSARVPPKLPGTFPADGETGQAAATKQPEWLAIGKQPGSARMAVVDALDKQLPDSGKTIPEHPAGYFVENHLWSARKKTVRLYGARNELVAFQMLFDKPVKEATFTLSFPDMKSITAEFAAVSTVGGDGSRLPDPLVPISASKPINLPLSRDGALGATRPAVLVELHTGDTKPGTYTGRLQVTTAQGQTTCDVVLTVWNFELPDQLTFLPELNCYDLPANEREYYRLAHRHRTVLNRVPYYQRGTLAEGCAPEWDGKRFDWSAWDQRFGAYFDGSAFADLPRAGVPLELFYLPLHENWPTPMEGNFNGSYWAESAFPASYREAFVEASRQYAEHLAGKSWKRTMFHVFLNNKVDFKKNGWRRGSSVWLLDEPANWQDYAALAFFGNAFKEGLQQAKSDVAMLYRCDISRPEWQRDALDQLLDYNVVAGEPFLIYNRLVLERKRAFGQVVMVYGTTNHPAESNVQPVAWALDTWSHGGDGILPWQTVGTAESWKRADALALLYPGLEGAHDGPVASIRLKAYTRAQQDVEYLQLVARAVGCRPEELGPSLRTELGLVGRKKSTGWAGEDAGVMDYGPMTPQSLWRLKRRLGTWLDRNSAGPAAARDWFQSPSTRAKSRGLGR